MTHAVRHLDLVWMLITHVEFLWFMLYVPRDTQNMTGSP